MSTATVRPFRFGFTGGASSKREKLVKSACTVEALGYSTFGLADHFVRPFAPLVAGQAVADATTSLRITQTVLAQDFREPAVLAKELATLDVLSEGRLQVGLGAGWLRQEYEDAGIRFAPVPVRIARLEETVIILEGLFCEGRFTFA
ncbi:MAG: LLM class flavin-dependent oxidoreductase, partial [Actinobacteria bacterium]|nr:LLM class flavin-dependent oxidoreductase [Actinomycetota bacterium]